MENNILSRIEQLRKEGKKIGLTATTGDLLHAGHISMFAESRAHCDFLICGLLSDPTRDRPDTKNKPIQSLFERWVQLQGIKYIDAVVPIESEDDLLQMIKVLRMDIRFVGVEYRGTKHTGWDIGEIFYNSREHKYSSSELRCRILEQEKLKNEAISPMSHDTKINK